MDYRKLTIEQLRDKVADGEVTDPLVYLEAIMNGLDLRGFSEVHKKVQEIDDFDDEPPTDEEWQELKEVIKKHAKYDFVSTSQSINAAKTLSEYLHPKLKSLQINGTLDGESNVDLTLTDEEIDIFKDRFNETF